jgi:hypothetical protein
MRSAGKIGGAHASIVQFVARTRPQWAVIDFMLS